MTALETNAIFVSRIYKRRSMDAVSIVTKGRQVAIKDRS